MLQKTKINIATNMVTLVFCWSLKINKYFIVIDCDHNKLIRLPVYYCLLFSCIKKMFKILAGCVLAFLLTERRMNNGYVGRLRKFANVVINLGMICLSG